MHTRRESNLPLTVEEHRELGRTIRLTCARIKKSRSFWRKRRWTSAGMLLMGSFANSGESIGFAGQAAYQPTGLPRFCSSSHLCRGAK